ncbi:unnamed protein product [Caenorhabditis bovis]|uniref:Major facilitator superfamily (MFS) profile domain-containing protein n=1 Tax=Caenorhabditis bovis TaxID=2654633 RepID=A0A8S1EXI6_9PELO|nr:unnamed protein product [Caenorhabditis bovis]
MPRVRLRSDVNAESWISRMSRQKWTKHHFYVFVHTFMSYAMLHATRKTLSTVKPSLIETWTRNSSTPHGPLFPTKQSAAEFLGGLDTGFMVAYAVGLFVSGILGDIYNPRRMLAIGMWLSSITVLNFGFVTEEFHFYSPAVYATLWIANGLIQSIAWPVEISIMGNWFGHNARGAVMGAWSSCASVGNIIGTMITSHFLYMGYQFPFLITCSILFLYGILVFMQLPSAPWEVGAQEIQSTNLENNIDDDDDEPTERPPPIGFFKAWLLPGVIAYSLAYACLKLVNYGFFFWLPYYLHSGLHWPEEYADSLSTWYDVGGIIAAILAGAFSDKMRSRTPVVFVMLILSTFALYIYAHSPPTYNWNAFLLAIAGFFVGGPANMISSSITADLGKCEQLCGNSEALSTVTGIIDGTGSIGAALGQWFIPSIQLWFGWNAIFYCFIIMMLCTASCLAPVLWKERKEQIHIHDREQDALLRGSDTSDDDNEDDMNSANMASFVIPKKKKKKVEVETEKEVVAPPKGQFKNTKAIDDEAKNLFKRFQTYFVDKEFARHLKCEEYRTIKNPYLEWKFDEFKKYLKSIGQSDQETLGFRESTGVEEEEFIAKNGLRVGSTKIGDIGDPEYGVYVYKSPETVNSSLFYFEKMKIRVMMFRTLRGKPYMVGIGSGEMEPQSGHVCHEATATENERGMNKRKLDHALAATYHYEFKPDGMSTYKFPAGVLPVAVIVFSLEPNSRVKSPLVSLKYPCFELHQVPLDEPILFKNSAFNNIPINFYSPLRFAEVPNGLFSIEFPQNPFFPIRKLDTIDEINVLRNEKFGSLITSLEVYLPRNEKSREKFASYSVIKPAKTEDSRFKQLIKSMRLQGAFIMGMDYLETMHIMFPSGEVATSLGIPYKDDVLHVVSIANYNLFIVDFDISAHADMGGKYAQQNFTSDVELRVDDWFEEAHEDYFSEKEKLASSDEFVLNVLNQQNSPTNDSLKYFVPLPPAGKSILYKGPIIDDSCNQLEDVANGRKPKRRPEFRVRWAANVVDNDNKQKNVKLLEKEKEERRPMSDSEREHMIEGNNIFKMALAATTSQTPSTSTGMPSPPLSNGMKYDYSPLNIGSRPSFEFPKLKPHPGSSGEHQNQKSFSVIRSLPLPPTARISTVNENSEFANAYNVESSISTPKIDETSQGDKIYDDDIPTFPQESDDEQENMEIDESEKSEKTPAEPEPQPQPVRPEENDILNFCLSSSRPTESSSSESLLNVLNLRPSTSKDRDFRPKDRDDRREKSERRDRDDRFDRRDRDDRRDRSRRFRSKSRSRSRSRERDREKERERARDKDERIVGPPRLVEIPVPANSQDLKKKMIENQLQEKLRKNGKDIDNKLEIHQPRALPNIVQASSFQPRVNFFNSTPGPPNPIRKPSNEIREKTPDDFESPASPPPNMVTISAPAPPIEEVHEIEEPDELRHSFVPATILPKAPVLVPTDGLDGWETKFNSQNTQQMEGGEASVKQSPPKRKPRKPFDHDSANSAVSSLKQADDCWMNAINKKTTAGKRVDEEEEGEIKSDEEGDGHGSKKNKNDIQIIEEDDDIKIIESVSTSNDVPNISQDRDDRKQRKSRFDAPPAVASQPVAGSVFFRNLAGPSSSQTARPTASYNPALQSKQFFLRPPFGAPPAQPPRISNSRFGGPPIPPPYGMRTTFPTLGMPSASSQVKQIKLIVMVDSMMFNRAIMAPELFKALADSLRALIVQGNIIKMLVHKHINDAMERGNETQVIYRNIIICHFNCLINIMPEHLCDMNSIRSVKDTLRCLTTCSRQYPDYELIYLSNFCPKPEVSRSLLEIGVHVQKLDALMDYIRRLQ